MRSLALLLLTACTKVPITSVIEIDRVTSVFPCPGEGGHDYLSEWDVARNETVLICETHRMSARVPDSLLVHARGGDEHDLWRENLLSPAQTHTIHINAEPLDESTLERARQLRRARNEYEAWLDEMIASAVDEVEVIESVQVRLAELFGVSYRALYPLDFTGLRNFMAGCSSAVREYGIPWRLAGYCGATCEGCGKRAPFPIASPGWLIVHLGPAQFMRFFCTQCEAPALPGWWRYVVGDIAMREKTDAASRGLYAQMRLMEDQGDYGPASTTAWRQQGEDVRESAHAEWPRRVSEKVAALELTTPWDPYGDD